MSIIDWILKLWWSYNIELLSENMHQAIQDKDWKKVAMLGEEKRKLAANLRSLL